MEIYLCYPVNDFIHHTFISSFFLCFNNSLFNFTDKGHVHLTNLAKQQWRIKGLSIEVLEPFRRLRITFNGLLKNIGRNSNEVEHVQFHFM